MKMKKMCAIFLTAAVCLGLTACGTAGSSVESESAVEKYSTGSYATDDVYETETTAGEDSKVEQENGESVETNRKLIKNVNMTVETVEFDELTKKLNDKVEGLGGYMENAYVDGLSINASNDSGRRASYTARIPVDKMEEFVSVVSAASNVLNKNETVEDVTLSYVDLESKKETLQIEQERLNTLLEEADSIETIIALESRLTEVRYELESMESQLRTYDNLVEYATVYLEVIEVERVSPQAKQSALEQMTEGFADSIYRIGRGIRSFCIGLVIISPYLVLWTVVIVVFVLIVKALIKRNQKKAMKKQNSMTYNYRVNNTLAVEKEMEDIKKE